MLNFTSAGLLISASTLDPSYGGDDTIKLGAGSNIVFGGFGNDKITAGAGNQIIVGDNGSVTYNTPGVLKTVTSSDPRYGGNDTIQVGNGNDLIIGGVGADGITVRQRQQRHHRR